MPDQQNKKIKLVISDFHLSRGRWLADGRRNPLEDFHQDGRFKEFLEYYSTGMIINGDFFDPLNVHLLGVLTAFAVKTQVSHSLVGQELGKNFRLHHETQ